MRLWSVLDRRLDMRWLWIRGPDPVSTSTPMTDLTNLIYWVKGFWQLTGYRKIFIYSSRRRFCSHAYSAVVKEVKARGNGGRNIHVTRLGNEPVLCYNNNEISQTMLRAILWKPCEGRDSMLIKKRRPVNSLHVSASWNVQIQYPLKTQSDV